MKKIISTLIILIAILSLALAACGNQPATPAPQTPVSAAAVIAEGHIRPVEGSMLSFQARGVVDEILVKPGDKVRAGDVLMRLANADQAAAQLVSAQQAYDLLLRNENGDRAALWQAYMNAQKERAKAQKKWDDLDLDNIQDRIDDAQKTVDDRRNDLNKELKDFEKYKDLGREDQKRKDAQKRVDNAQADLNEAIAKVESIMRERDEVRAKLDAALAAEAEAKHQYEISANGPNAEKLALAKAQLEAAKDALSAYQLTAPFDGVVTDVAVQVGDQVGPETVAVSVANFREWIVETTDITELEVVKLAEGQTVSMVPDALPEVELTGVVETISQSFKQQSGDILYTVRIKVKDVDPRVRWGMTMQITFKPLPEK
jgi:multidrug efflux pump subunit AcrA (membrane-fusion protein)